MCAHLSGKLYCREQCNSRLTTKKHYTKYNSIDGTLQLYLHRCIKVSRTASRKHCQLSTHNEHRFSFSTVRQGQPLTVEATRIFSIRIFSHSPNAISSASVARRQRCFIRVLSGHRNPYKLSYPRRFLAVTNYVRSAILCRNVVT